MRKFFAGAALTVLAATPTFAQNDPPVDCANATTQMDLSSCAARDFEAADAELNAQYKKTRKIMAEWDTELSADMKGAEKALLKAQRAWLDYRDGHCEATGFQARGGSMEPMLVSGCQAELTRERTKQLKDLSEGFGN